MKKTRREKTIAVCGVAVSFLRGNGAIKGAFLKENLHPKPGDQITGFAERYVVREWRTGIYLYFGRKLAIGQESVFVTINCVVNN